ncbi:MAG TPA: asparagine synthase (glutamine-hydrolyzing) [Bryobacteraceae bacterium]|nr:asparagine synthase (glutamine-hydrolyzing) [Bryobacteraceae bacterium]
MCGIAGFTHLKSRPDPARIRAAVAAIVHRGPDQQGVFESDTVSLAIARLKIIDLETGAQPFFSPDGDTVIVFNGEVYNHAELRRELEQHGHRFRSHSDTEVVLASFLEWDVECFARFRGMFGLAIWTKSTGRLVLARDRLGIKPLYLARRGPDVYFASELKSIFVHPEIERHLNPAALDCYLSLNYVPAPYTMVQGIEKLAPGHWMEWQGGETRSESYWRIPNAPTQKWSLDDATAKLDSLMQASVKEHLLSDVPLGLWLSSGLDSSSLLHYAAAASSTPIKTLSISFAGRSFDEAAPIRELAARYGAHHQEFDVNPESGLGDAIEQFAYHFDEPNADGGALPVWFLSRMTRQHVTVALSGEGADELFGGYLTYRADMLARWARRIPKAVLRLGGAAASLLPVSDEKIGLEYKVKRFLAGCRLPANRAHVFWNGVISRDLVDRPLPDALNGILSELSPQGDSLEAYLRFDQQYYLPDDLLAKVDRMSMAHSIEVRPPYLDHRIVEFAATLPAHLKMRGKRQKIVLRELMRGKLPESTLRRPKMGFDFPAHHWMRGPLRTLMMDTLSADHWRQDLFNPAALQNLAESHLERRGNFGYELWGIMLLLLWMKRWSIQPIQSPAVQPVPAGILTST